MKFGALLYKLLITGSIVSQIGVYMLHMHVPEVKPVHFRQTNWNPLQEIRHVVQGPQDIMQYSVTKDKFFQELNITVLDIPLQRIHGLPRPEKVEIWKKGGFIWEANICFAARRFKEAGSVEKHVLFTYMNENRGAFSRDIPNRTIDWDDKATVWTSWGCQDEEIWEYLNHSNTRAVFTTQHQSIDHPKVHSLPLGIYIKIVRKELWENMQRDTEPRTQLLMINDNGARHRSSINAQVIDNFHGTINNTYGSTKQQYLDELRRSKFILASSGLGWDCYRIWEALYMGTIPVIELYNRPKDGWRRSLEGLPVLWVPYLIDVTPEFLEEAYERMIHQQYNYSRLSMHWWTNFMKDQLL